MPSPKNNTARFQRTKYYSAVKTGMKHMNPATMRESFLRPPRAEEALPPIMLAPLLDKEGKSASHAIIFSCWNTMVGSSLVLLPGNF